MKLVAETDARGRTLEIYQEVKQALGLPYVNTFFQAYGAYPQFLEQHWRVLRPVVETGEFFRLAERIGADAYTRMHNYFDIPDLGARLLDGEGERRELAAAIELFHYNNPLLLLISTVQMQAFDSRTGQQLPASAPVHPVFSQAPSFVDEETIPPGTRRSLEEMKRLLGTPFINTAYHSFARWPNFLACYWEMLRQLSQSPVYMECLHGVRETAWALAREVPRPVELTVSELIDSGMADDDVTTVVRLTESFMKTLAGMVLNVAVAKIGLEGGTAAKPGSPSAGEEAEAEEGGGSHSDRGPQPGRAA